MFFTCCFILHILFTGKAWIGLYDDLQNGWRWSLNDSRYYGEGETTFRNWYTNQPNNLNDQQYCVELFTGSPYFGKWGDSHCTLRRPFVCYNGEFSYSVQFNKAPNRSNQHFQKNLAQVFAMQQYFFSPLNYLYIFLLPFTDTPAYIVTKRMLSTNPL